MKFKIIIKKIHIFEKDKKPFGLLRTGVAPDNMPIKAMIN